MKKWCVVLLIVYLAGCTEAAPATDLHDAETDYQPFVVIERKTYQGLYTNNGTLEIEEKIGEVTNKTRINQTPKTELESNVLEEGTAIYSVKTYDHYFIAELGGEEVIFVAPGDFEELGILMKSE
ncbi:hypothetical protein JCM19046_677 [Bacillus sp. JCM 19046]|uniref:Lipoprotein n=1 Tax=Shouchella xiaoxiensis TaxID=766895 RepID=A0ABS2STJ0_9BACI|nr:hypothetical protein [Shouchella xiaoxiensis]MBM7838806.1 hypothetical protein [Shouchella xiaoxiensis]GAF11968.1 hypothetical protein JCM19045_1111 [Bacillus sp. JCM 19045]GAF16261.1 hypothetical protein JCM19046_677 [Bacillus sp. JCM 19046]